MSKDLPIPKHLIHDKTVHLKRKSIDVYPQASLEFSLPLSVLFRWLR